MEWVVVCEEFIGKYGYGARGRHIGISRMFHENDILNIKSGKFVATYRPRGILSGFLAIVPQLGYAVFLPPIAAKIQPLRIRLRVSDELLQSGAVFSAYMTREKKLILEDVLVWKHTVVWSLYSFEQRWNIYMKQFVEKECMSDPEFQTIPIALAQYQSLASVVEPPTGTVLEFVPNHAGKKRLIWMHPKVPHSQIAVGPETATRDTWIAKKEPLGPDVYTIYKNTEKLGTALIRTLGISRALRNAEKTEIPVRAEFNKTFDKWEITEVIV